MKKLILSIFLFFVVIAASAQLTSNQGKYYTDFPGIDYVFVFNGITNSTSITYNGSALGLKWYTFTNPTPIYLGVDTFDQLADNTGYVLEMPNGNKIYFWVIDYQKYIPASKALSIENNPAAQCEDLKLFFNIPTLSYSTFSGVTHYLPREYKLKYQTLGWTGSAWKQVDSTQTIVMPLTEKSITVPYCNTTFTLTGDQYATDLGISPSSSITDTYTSNAVICKATSVLTLRTETNEEKRPSLASQHEGSAPLDFQFLSNANEPIAQYYNWQIFKDNSKLPLITRNDKDHRYTFTQAGIYKVKISASNSFPCVYTDSIIITVSESEIYAPNVFTPNGDGLNDEFRVAYKSINTFQCWIYNRWGNELYTWTDPTKGWNGKYNGVDVKPGAYYYVIKALGSDYNPNSTPNPKTHRRVGEYLLKGDINLLR